MCVCVNPAALTLISPLASPLPAVICLAAALPADSNPFIFALLCSSSGYQDNMNPKQASCSVNRQRHGRLGLNNCARSRW